VHFEINRPLGLNLTREDRLLARAPNIERHHDGFVDAKRYFSEFVEWTPENHLRHTHFPALRDDKRAQDVHRK
jgi:hypothetical protein